MNAFLEVKALFDSAKAEEYLGEDITLVEHMIQCAELAKKENAPSWLVVAALLHDIGHILVPDAATAQDSGVDLHHDEVGAEWIARRFPNNVVQAVKLHVDAKKYLVATDASYLEKLSAASQITLAIQGGVFTDQEAEDFLTQPFAAEAVRLRLWDDAGKVRGAALSSLLDFETEINVVALL
ncbi:MAG: HD domain-containing protein [Actinomycetes bacterium]